MSEVTIFTKEELIEALCFEYGVRYFNADILHSTKANITYLKRNIAYYESLRDNAPSEGNRNHYSRMVIQTRRRLLLWHEVERYLAQDICPVCGDHCQDDMALYGMCAECHDQQAKAHVCEHCGGQGEVQVHIAGNSWNSNDPGAWQTQRCEHCGGTGKLGDSAGRIALSAGLAECFALLEENMQSTNRLWLDMVQGNGE